jgi:hypothetical protein
MPKPSPPPFLAATVAALLAIACLTGCGSSTDSVTHIEGSSQTISKAMLDHWMRAVVATDFRVSIGTKAPRGFASEPARPSECAEAAKKVVPRSFTGKLKLADAQIARKCRELHEAIKAQAMSYILSAQWVMLQAKQQGLHLSEAELHREFLRFRKEEFGGQARFLTYMNERQLILSDVLYQLRRNVFTTRLLPKFEQKVKAAGGGQKTYARLALERYHRLISKTSCKEGYVMEDCREYRAPAVERPSPDAILEAFVGGVKKT